MMVSVTVLLPGFHTLGSTGPIQKLKEGHKVFTSLSAR